MLSASTQWPTHTISWFQSVCVCVCRSVCVVCERLAHGMLVASARNRQHRDSMGARACANSFTLDRSLGASSYLDNRRHRYKSSLSRCLAGLSRVQLCGSVVVVNWVSPLFARRAVGFAHASPGTVVHIKYIERVPPNSASAFKFRHRADILSFIRFTSTPPSPHCHRSHCSCARFTIVRNIMDASRPPINNSDAAVA